MNTAELTALLGRIQVLDNRQVDELTLQAWEPLVAKVEYEDAVQAVNAHFTSSDKYLLPVHVVEGSRKFRASRIHARSRTATHRIIELGGQPPRMWDDSPVTSEELADIGKRLELGDPSADDDVRKIVSVQRRVAESIEAGRQLIQSQQVQP